ncbi:uncharacterized protein METZ01_LOCUS328910, partial [marine metagenome]
MEAISLYRYDCSVMKMKYSLSGQLPTTVMMIPPDFFMNRSKSGAWFQDTVVNLDCISSQKFYCWPLGVKFSGISPCSTNWPATRRWNK